MVFKTDYSFMQVKNIAECSKGREHSAILSPFIKLSVVIKTFVLSIFECLFYTGFTVYVYRVCTDLEKSWKMTCLEKLWNPDFSTIIIENYGILKNIVEFFNIIYDIWKSENSLKYV